MKTVLALETSSDSASIALWHEGKVAHAAMFASKRSLSADLFPALSTMLADAPTVEGIVVGLGPGSYAGVRIGIAAAIGLQSVWNCALVGIPSAAAMGTPEETFSVIGDARRGTWYFSEVAGGRCIFGPVLLESDDALIQRVAGAPGALRSAETLGDAIQARLASLGTVALTTPQAAILARLAAEGTGITQRHDLEPIYLREPHITLPKGV
ncbi:MAG: tRNA (adenosine(37)-N6)-threonylcarbamoyltransferase complex dimerization subunit type 1 TsaB [Verrucomicrobia bacterium]|nr:tRNA (adenosine(37)-N6)-threonylcarbamoyltransferase complex dimerization subunit type 1 TsaB [Verrucomicrobiota bacterium]